MRSSALLIGLLAAGEIDGALVSKPSGDPDEQWKGVATIATTAGEILAASGSFSTSHGTGRAGSVPLQAPGQTPHRRCRDAVRGSGTPRHARRRWPTGAHRVDAVVLSIALMCTKNFDYEALTLREFREQAGSGSGPGVENGRHTGTHDRRIP